MDDGAFDQFLPEIKIHQLVASLLKQPDKQGCDPPISSLVRNGGSV
jgi:hypothetical protein